MQVYKNEDDYFIACFFIVASLSIRVYQLQYQIRLRIPKHRFRELSRKGINAYISSLLLSSFVANSTFIRSRLSLVHIFIFFYEIYSIVSRNV